MAATEQKINKSIGAGWIRDLGYSGTETPMDAQIDSWWNWYRSANNFYSYKDSDGTSQFKVERISFSPARMVCEDWASILFNEHTVVGLSGVVDLDDDEVADESLQRADDWVQEWVRESGLMDNAETIERAFGLGAAAWALELANVNEDGTPNDKCRVVLRSYDARAVVPLSFDGRDCTEAAFCRTVTISGAEYIQWMAYLLQGGEYVIYTAFFKGNSQRVYFDGYSNELHTGLDIKPFQIIRPANDNTYWEHGPFGASIFDNAIGAVKLADGSFDNAWKDIYLGQKLLGIPEEMLQYNEDGTITVPRERQQQLFMKMGDSGLGGKSGIYEYNPDLRVEANRLAVNTALSLLGKRCGFGFRYYSMEEGGGLKTAKEVASDNAELMRNAKKHEQVLSPAVTGIIECAAALATRFGNADLPEIDGLVTVTFGDTIIEDDTSERERMRADVAAGLLPAWKYTEAVYGVTAERAKEWTEGAAEDPTLPLEA